MKKINLIRKQIKKKKKLLPEFLKRDCMANLCVMCGQ